MWGPEKGSIVKSSDDQLLKNSLEDSHPSCDLLSVFIFFSPRLSFVIILLMLIDLFAGNNTNNSYPLLNPYYEPDTSHFL